MGKAARLRRERRRRDDPIKAIVAQFGRDELQHLLSAAACSPTACHRLNCIAALLAATLRDGESEGPRVRRQDLDGFLDTVEQAHPELAYQRDWLPPDPRKDVRVRLGDELFRLHPGAHERPVANIARSLRVARCIDPYLYQRRGFGLGDLIEVALGHVDACLQVLAPAWTGGPVSAPSRPASVSKGEIAAVRRWPDITDAVNHCSAPTAAETALEWATCPSVGLRFSADPTEAAALGPVLAVDTAEGRLALPPPLLLEGLEACVHRLAREAGQAAEVAHRWEDMSNRWVAGMLGRTQHTLLGPFMPPGRTGTVMLLNVARRHFLAVGVAATLDPSQGVEPLHRAYGNLKEVRPGTQLDHERDGFVVPNDTVIERAIILATAAHMAASSPSDAPVIPLEDLEWICHEAAEHRDDVFDFIGDLSRHEGIGALMGMETINIFEHWRDQDRTLLRSGHDFDLAVLDLHRGEAEWEWHAQLLPAQQVLASIGLPPIETWTAVDADRDGPLALFEPTIPSGWMLSRSVPAAVEVLAPTSHGEDVGTAENLASCLLWLLEQAGGTIADLVESTGGRPLILRLRQRANATAVPPVTSEPGDDVMIRWQPRLHEEELEQHGQSQQALVDSIITGLEARSGDSDELASLRTKLEELPAAFRSDGIRFPQHRVDLPAPHEPNGRDLGAMVRHVAQAVLDADVSPAAYAGREAMDIETTIVHPALETELLDRLASFDADELLELAAEQLEQATARRVLDRTRAGFNARLPTITFDPAERAAQAEQEGSQLGRAITLIIEHILAAPPSGTVVPDRRDWTGILAVARLVAQSGLRSEQLAFGVTPAELRVGDDGVIDVAATEPAIVDFDLLHHTRASETIASRAASDDENDPPEPDDVEEPRITLTQAIPALVPVDTALKEAYGFSLQALLDVLDVVQRWPVPRGSVIACVTDQQLVDACRAAGVDEVEAEAAINTLTLRGRDLAEAGIEHWELERRAVRAVTRPLLETAGSDLLILPWFVGASRSVYTRYLNDGRLPWPPRATAEPLVHALRAVRQDRNDDLEDRVHEELKQAGLLVRSRILPRKAKKLLGIGHLTGEIDSIAVDEGQATIWVVEAKDPQEAFSVKQIDQQLTDFQGKGGYVDKLLAKTVDVETNPQSVAEHLGSIRTGAWAVRSLLVLRRWSHAAFFRGSSVPFTVITDLAAVTKGAASPVQLPRE